MEPPTVGGFCIVKRAGDDALGTRLRRPARSMVQGTVKWFNESKGFGFLSQEGGPDVFVHHSEIRADGYRTLNEGDKVQFEIADSPKGPRAANVTVVR
jgi:CspA family cold shock protein